MKIIGHRGAAGTALENSSESIQRALALEVTAIEIDVRRTKDGQLVVIHDKHTGRVANKRLAVAQSTLTELKTLQLKNGQRILTLDEALKLIGEKVSVVIDLKHGGLDTDLEPILKKYPKMHVTLSSRSHAQLRKLRKNFPNLHITPRSYIHSTDIVDIARHMGANGISVNKWVMNPLTYHLAKRAGLTIHTYTINHPLMVRIFNRLYPEIHIITNHPERFTKKKP